MGVVRVDEYWTFHAAGGCEGLVVRVHHAERGQSSELPTREFGYEMPGAVVLEQRGRWFRVRLATGSAWIETTERDEFHPLEELLIDGLTFLTEA